MLAGARTGLRTAGIFRRAGPGGLGLFGESRAYDGCVSRDGTDACLKWGWLPTNRNRRGQTYVHRISCSQETVCTSFRRHVDRQV